MVTSKHLSQDKRQSGNRQENKLGTGKYTRVEAETGN